MNKQEIIQQVFDLQLFRSIQEKYSKATGLSFVTVDYKGLPLTEYSEFTEYCKEVRKLEGYGELCEQCDAHGGLHAAITGQPYIYKCHSGLVDFALPITYEGSYIGALLGGQVRLSPQEEKDLDPILPHVTRTHVHPHLVEAYNKIPIISYDKLHATVMLLNDLIKLSTNAAKANSDNIINEETAKELQQERDHRIKLETTLSKQHMKVLASQEILNDFFKTMNVLTTVAQSENATKTAEICYNFTDTMRYSVDYDRKISTIGEEINYIRCVLNIQKIWLSDKLQFTLPVEEIYNNISCPYMAVHKVLVAVINAYEDSSEISIDISIKKDNEGISIIFSARCHWAGLEDLEARSHTEHMPDHAHITNLDKTIRRSIGKKFGLVTGDRTDGVAGSWIAIKLPIKEA